MENEEFEDWNSKFKELERLLHDDLTRDNYIPKSISLMGSRILTLQKFWILCIENFLNIAQTQLNNINDKNQTSKDTEDNTYQTSIFEIKMRNLEKLINLFNESFNYVSEESVLKKYFLKKMKSLDSDVLRNTLENKGNINLF
jgi:hypothetical protein